VKVPYGKAFPEGKKNQGAVRPENRTKLIGLGETKALRGKTGGGLQRSLKGGKGGHNRAVFNRGVGRERALAKSTSATQSKKTLAGTGEDFRTVIFT